jgi:hypothetical protein
MYQKVYIQTVLIDPNDNDFKEIGEFVNELMRKRAFPRKIYKGSWSWFPTRGAETIAKLCYLRRDQYCFGLREEECAKHGLQQLKYPLSFGVLPQVGPTFYGFSVNNDEKGREALEKFIGKIPEALPSMHIPGVTVVDDFDINDFLRQL